MAQTSISCTPAASAAARRALICAAVRPREQDGQTPMPYRELPPAAAMCVCKVWTHAVSLLVLLPAYVAMSINLIVDGALADSVAGSHSCPAHGKSIVLSGWRDW